MISNQQKTKENQIKFKKIVLYEIFLLSLSGITTLRDSFSKVVELVLVNGRIWWINPLQDYKKIKLIGGLASLDNPGNRTKGTECRVVSI